MMQLDYFLRLFILFFAVIGFQRGWYREFVTLAGLILSLFLLTEFGWVIDVLVGRGSVGLRFTLELVIFSALAYFAYDQAPETFVPSRYIKGTKIRLPEDQNWQTRLVAALIGGFNGYLVVGTLWYLMDQFEYPLDNFFVQPPIGSTSAAFVSSLPLVWLQQGNLLMWLVTGLFLLLVIFR